MNAVAGEPSPADTDGPSISFLCTAYRTEDYLPGTIASVLAQTRADWELVVCDNGMSEAIRDVVLAVDDPRVVLVRQENAGMEGGVQAAAAVATGRYFSVLNSDDQVLPGFVERMAGLLDRHPEVDAVGCDALVYDGDTGRYRRASFQRSHGMRRPPRFADPVRVAELIDGKVIYYTAAIRRAWWFAVGGFVDGVGTSDTALWMRMLGAGADVRLVGDVLGHYLYRSDSLSRSPESAAAFQASQERAYLDGAAGSDDPEVFEALARRLRRLRYFDALRAARTALLHGDLPRARDAADRAVALRRTPRGVAVAAAVRVAPHALSRTWPLKQEATRAAGRAAAALDTTRRRVGARP